MLCKHQDFRRTLQHSHQKPDVATCKQPCDLSAVMVRDIGITGACWMAAWLQIQGETLSEGIVIESDRVSHLTSSCAQTEYIAHMHIC